MVFVPCLQRADDGVPRLGEQLLDEYLRFVAARCRPNTLLAQSFDLKVFFGVVGKPPLEVGTADVLRFIENNACRVSRRWSGSLMVRPGWRRRRSNAGWRPSPGCSITSPPGVR